MEKEFVGVSWFMWREGCQHAMLLCQQVVVLDIVLRLDLKILL